MNTRQEIVNYLLVHPHSCALELSEALLKSRADIQYHLKNLERNHQIVQIPFAKSKKHSGRPTRYYSLSQAVRPSNIPALADILLDLYRRAGDTEIPLKKESFLQELARSLIPPIQQSGSITTRLNILVKEFSSKGYQARWEAHANGPQIVFRNCPYLSLLPRHPELCQVDLLAIQQNLGISAKLLSQILLPQSTSCRFIFPASQHDRV